MYAALSPEIEGIATEISRHELGRGPRTYRAGNERTVAFTTRVHSSFTQQNLRSVHATDDRADERR